MNNNQIYKSARSHTGITGRHSRSVSNTTSSWGLVAFFVQEDENFSVDHQSHCVDGERSQGHGQTASVKHLPALLGVGLPGAVPEPAVVLLTRVRLHATLDHVQRHDQNPAEDAGQPSADKVDDRRRDGGKVPRPLVSGQFVEGHVDGIGGTVSSQLRPEAPKRASHPVLSEYLLGGLERAFVECGLPPLQTCGENNTNDCFINNKCW